MTEKEQKERASIVTEAISYLKTPYHHQGRIKGAGIDCGMFLVKVFEACGLIPHLELGVDIPYYSYDFALHRDEENYLEQVLKFAKRVDRRPLPGDIILYLFGRCNSHAAIVVDWPTVIHSYLNIGVIYSDSEHDALLLDKFGNSRQRAVLSYWG